jgi:hypothetical protein
VLLLSGIPSSLLAGRKFADDPFGTDNDDRIRDEDSRTAVVVVIHLFAVIFRNGFRRC